MIDWSLMWSAYRRRKVDVHIYACIGVSAVFWALFTLLWFTNTLPR